MEIERNAENKGGNARNEMAMWVRIIMVGMRETMENSNENHKFKECREVRLIKNERISITSMSFSY